jgi:hypothetical protein
MLRTRSNYTRPRAKRTRPSVCLLPGLELMLAADASPVVVRAAQRICDEYVGVRGEAAQALSPTAAS